MKSLVERLRDRCTVESETDCWRWKQTLNSAGLPCIHISGLTQHPMTVRRLMWCLACGPIHAKHIVSTSCGDALCVNPAHLVKMPRAQHAKQMLREVNMRRTSVDRRRTANEFKHKRSGYKLSQKKADDIRKALAAGSDPLLVATSFGISVGYLYKIKAGKRWAEVRPPAWHP